MLLHGTRSRPGVAGCAPRAQPAIWPRPLVCPLITRHKAGLQTALAGPRGSRGAAIRAAAFWEDESVQRLVPGGPVPCPAPLMDVADGLETPIQLIYLLTLLGFLAGGAYLVARQVLIRRELDEAAKALGERIRTGEASCEDYYELGVILARKKLYTQATKNLEKAKKVWDGEESELAQVHNALGFCYFQMEKAEMAVPEYKRAVELQPGYVTAWNNLGDAYEKLKDWRQAMAAYKEVLTYAPGNEVASQRFNACREKVERMSTTSL